MPSFLVQPPKKLERQHCAEADFLNRPDALPVTQPTVSKHWRGSLTTYNVVSCLTQQYNTRVLYCCVRQETTLYTRRLATANRSCASNRGQPWKNIPHIEFDPMQHLVVVSHTACTHVASPINCVMLGPCPLGIRRVADGTLTRSYHLCCYHAKFGHSRSNHTRV